MMAQPQTVGFIGAGQLGEPTIIRLLDHGHRVSVYVRRDEMRTRLRDHGAIVVDSPADVATAELVILFVYSDDQLREVALGSDGVIAAMAAGTPLAIHTTASLQLIEDLAAAAEPAGVPVLDAPVSGTAQDIAAGELTVLVGGEPTAVTRATELFRAYASPVIATGGRGTAMKTKLLNNVLFAANLQLVADAARLADQLGIDPAAGFEALSVSSSASKAMGYLMQYGALAGFAASAAPYLRKDVAAARAASDALGIDLGLIGHVAATGPLDLT